MAPQKSEVISSAPLKASPQESSQGFVSLAYFQLPESSEEVFCPEEHLDPIKAKKFCEATDIIDPLQATLPLAIAAHHVKDIWLIPRAEDCFELWEKYSMMPHIREHSQCVADFAVNMAHIAVTQGATLNVQSIYAAGLLHDLAKTYCIQNGGNHAQLGCGWVMRETGNPRIAQAVLYHVHWPWEDILDQCMLDDSLFMVMALIYADKRVMHNGYVTIEDRFTDLQERYGKTDLARERIQSSYEQGKNIEAAFARRFGVQLNEYTIDSGRLVKRA